MIEPHIQAAVIMHVCRYVVLQAGLLCEVHCSKVDDSCETLVCAGDDNLPKQEVQGTHGVVIVLWVYSLAHFRWKCSLYRGVEGVGGRVSGTSQSK